MASQKAKSVVMMSINPGFAELILSGKKKVEFRKSKFNDAITKVIIYATSPIKSIVGYFEVEGVVCGSPDELWKQFKEHGGVDADFFQEYYKSTQKGYAIKVGNIYPFPNSLDIEEIVGQSPPPQSFYYIDSEVLDHAKENGCKSTS